MSELSKLKLERAMRRHLKEGGSPLDVFDEDVRKEIENRDKDADTLLSEMLSCQLNKQDKLSTDMANKIFKKEIEDKKDDD